MATITISRETAKEMLIDNKYLELLVDDFQYGAAQHSMDTGDNSFFELPDEKRAKIISDFIKGIIDTQLTERVLEYLRKEK